MHCFARSARPLWTFIRAGSGLHQIGLIYYALKINNSSPKSVVLKFGSRLLTNGTAELDTERMATVARAVAACGDQDVVIVSSGAVAAGFRALGHTTPPTRIADRQAAAAVGQGRLMKLWSDAFQEVGLSVGQVLITNDCLTDRKRYVAARRALRALLQAGVVPIVNENDTVSVDEIVVGDNDNLAAMTAALVDADLLALLTDVPGVYDRDPDDDPTARIVTRASSAEELRALCFGKKEIVSTVAWRPSWRLRSAQDATGCPRSLLRETIRRSSTPYWLANRSAHVSKRTQNRSEHVATGWRSRRD